MSWKSISSAEQIAEIINESHAQPVIIFKHSTSCPISSMAKLRFENKWHDLNEEIVFYYLDILSYRNLSNKIAAITGVQHESPQLLLLKEGTVIHDASHFKISVDAVISALSASSYV